MWRGQHSTLDHIITFADLKLDEVCADPFGITSLQPISLGAMIIALRAIIMRFLILHMINTTSNTGSLDNNALVRWRLTADVRTGSDAASAD